MLAIDQAIKTRWNAKSLSTTITGGIWFSYIPENTAMPYCSYSHVSDAKTAQSRASRYSEKQVQFTVFAATPELAGQYAELIKAAFLHCDRAATNPLSVGSSSGKILDCSLVQNPVIMQESDAVFSAALTLAVQYVEDGALTPA